MQPSCPPGWAFIDDQGTFELVDPQETSYLYLPLVNQAGMMSSVTPTFNGDAKTGQNAFLLLPVSVEDLHNSRAARNFWVSVDGEPWSATGNSAAQAAHRRSNSGEPVTLTAGLLWQTVQRTHPDGALQAEVTSFVPDGDDCVELMQVLLTNRGEKPLTLTATAAIPVYGRSADNLRDHRHVTSLLNRTTCHRHGVLVCPTLSFAEGSHRPNLLTYAVLGAEGDGTPPAGFFPVLEDFIGEGGALDWPAAVVNGSAPVPAGSPVLEGSESIGSSPPRFRPPGPPGHGSFRFCALPTASRGSRDGSNGSPCSRPSGG
jgi:cellobiose phosphorylase